MLVGLLHEVLDELGVLHLVALELRVIALVLVHLPHYLLDTTLFLAVLRRGDLETLVDPSPFGLGSCQFVKSSFHLSLNAHMVCLVHLEEVHILIHVDLLVLHLFLSSLNINCLLV